MDYSTAANIRKKGLSSSLTERLLGGQGIGSSIKESIGEAIKAKAIGVKEKFDPMNIAKVLTGGSNIAPALVGRLMGKKSEDISYFTGKKKGKKDPNYSSIGEGPPVSLRANDSHADVAAKFYRFMEADILFRETFDKDIDQYRKDLDNAKERHKNELISVITGKEIKGTHLAPRFKTKPKTKKTTTKEGSSFLKYGLVGAAITAVTLYSEDAFASIMSFQLPGWMGGTPAGDAGLSFSQLSKEEQDKLLEAQYRMEGGGKADSLVNRLKNPGAMKYADWMKKYGAEKGDKGFAKFSTMEQGRAAQRHLWESEGYRNLPISEAAKKWTGASGKELESYTGALVGSARPQSNAVDLASSMLGKDESKNRMEIQSYLQKGGHGINPDNEAWCAAFVGSSLTQSGIKDSGSNVATSYLKWGQKVDPSNVQRGDVLVESNGKAPGQTGGHVGFATGNIKDNKIEMISGNKHNQVAKNWVDNSKVEVRRSSATASQMATNIPKMDLTTPSQIPSELQALFGGGQTNIILSTTNNVVSENSTTNLVPKQSDDNAAALRKLFGWTG